jgi:hypothetical protein
MKLLVIKIVVHKRGYAKDGDELEQLTTDARGIVDNYIKQMNDELDQAGYYAIYRMNNEN